MSQDESKKPEPFLPDEVKDFDSLVEWLRWREHQPRDYYHFPWPWKFRRVLFAKYGSEDDVIKAFSGLMVTLAYAVLCLNALEPLVFRRAVLTLAAYALFSVMRMIAWLIDRKTLAKGLEEIRRQSIEDLLKSYFEKKITELRVYAIWDPSGSLAERKKRLRNKTYELPEPDKNLVQSQGYRIAEHMRALESDTESARRKLEKIITRIEAAEAEFNEMVRSSESMLEEHQARIIAELPDLSLLESAAELEPSIFEDVRKRKKRIFRMFLDLGLCFTCVLGDVQTKLDASAALRVTTPTLDADDENVPEDEESEDNR